MVTSISTLSLCGSSYVRNSKPNMALLSSCSCSYSSHLSHKVPNFPISSQFSQMGFCHFTHWNGLRQMGISISPSPKQKGRKEKCRGKVVHASLFGVGAPEALVIGAVALLVFGPKGLAEVARNLGKTLRAFQPTIRELQEVSREFKNTLEQEIGLNDDPNTYGSNRANTITQSPSAVDPNGTPSNNANSNEDPLKIIEEHIALNMSAPKDLSSSPQETQIETGSQSEESNPSDGAVPVEDQLKITEDQPEAFSSAQNVSSSSSAGQIEESQLQAGAAPFAQEPESEK